MFRGMHLYLAALFIIGAYLIGSFSSAIITCRIMGLPDPRTQGSKNPGATNVLRIGGKKAAAITMLGDVLKGFLPVLAAQYVTSIDANTIGWVALAAMLGHMYPVFFGFQGGKGVATAMGGLFALDAMLGFIFVGAWLVTLALFRMSSFGSLMASILMPVAAWFVAPFFLPALILMALFIIWRHQDNIQRLLKGTESKVGDKAKV